MAEITAGDRVPMMLNSLVGEPNEVALPPLGDLHWNADRATRVPRTMRPELAELVGYFMGDGSLHAKGIRLCVTDGDDDVLDRLVDLGRELFGLEAHLTQCEGYTEVALHSVPLTIWWEACGFAKLRPFEGHTGKGWSAAPSRRRAPLQRPRGLRRVPARAVRSRRQCQPRLRLLVYDLEDFSRDVQTLMLALGFVTTRGMDGSRVKLGAPCHRIRLLNAATGMRFAAQVGFMSARKNQALIEAEHPQAARYDHVPIGSRACSTSWRPRTTRCARRCSCRFTQRRGLAPLLRPRCSSARRASSSSSCSGTSTTRSPRPSSLKISRRSISRCPTTSPTSPTGSSATTRSRSSWTATRPGVEPDFSLVKFKELVGGGQMTIVNQTIPMALRTLGYYEPQIEQIEAHIDEHATIVGAPGLAGRAPVDLRRGGRRARDLAHGPHQDDGRGAAVHLGRDLARL